MRYIFHLLIVIAVVVGFQVWGADGVESRLTTGTHWVASKTGLSGAWEWWRDGVYPPLKDTSRTTSERTYYGLMRALDRAQQVTVDVPDWLRRRAADVRNLFGGEKDRAGGKG